LVQKEGDSKYGLRTVSSIAIWRKVASGTILLPDAISRGSQALEGPEEAVLCWPELGLQPSPPAIDLTSYITSDYVPRATVDLEGCWKS
jgi:hypothetical protein